MRCPKKIFADASEGDEEALLREERSTVSLIMLGADGLSAMLVRRQGPGVQICALLNLSERGKFCCAVAKPALVMVRRWVILISI